MSLQVKYYPWPERQTLEQLACNELAVNGWENNQTHMTGKALVKAINDRIGSSHTEADLEACVGGFGSELLKQEKGYTKISFVYEQFSDYIIPRKKK